MALRAKYIAKTEETIPNEKDSPMPHAFAFIGRIYMISFGYI